MSKIILLLIFYLAGVGNQLCAYDRLEINDSSDRRFLPYSLRAEYGYDIGAGRKPIPRPLQVFRQATSDTALPLVVNAVNPPLNADAPASIIVLDYVHERVVSEDPVYVTLNDFFVYPRPANLTPYVVAGCYRHDSAFVIRNEPGTNRFDFVYLTSGVDHTGNGSWEPDVGFLGCEDYDFDGVDEAFFYVNPGRDLEPRILFCIEVEPFGVEWSFPIASSIGKGMLASCRDSLNPSVILVAYGPQNGVSDDEFDDRYGYLVKLDSRGRLLFKKRILSDYNSSRLWPLDDVHSRFCVFHDLPLRDDESGDHIVTQGGWLSVVDRDGRVQHSLRANDRIRSLWLFNHHGDSRPRLYSLWNDGTVRVLDDSLAIQAESRPTSLLSFIDTVTIPGQTSSSFIFAVRGGMEIYSSKFMKLAFLENAPLYRGTVVRTADGVANSLVLSNADRGMVVEVDRRDVLALSRSFLWEYQRYFLAFTFFLLLAFVVVNFLRVRAMARLHHRERDLSVVFENMEDCFYRATSDGRLVWHSPSTARLLGYRDSTELTGRSVVEFYVHPEQRDALLTELRRSGKVTDYEVELRHNNGSSIIVSTNSAWWRGRDGKIMGVEGIFRDVTARRRMARAMRESEEKYRAVIEHSGDNIYFFDPETGRVLESNESLRRTLGYTHDEMTELTIYNFIDHDRDDIADKVKRAMKHDLSFLSERRYVRKDGSRVDVEVGVTRVDYAGKAALCIVSRDITARKRAEAALRESEEKYRTLVENAGEAIFSVDRDMRYLFMNSVSAQRIGRSRDELIGRRIRDAFPPDVAERHEASLTRVFKTGTGETRESLTVLKGEVRRYRTSLQPIRNGVGDVTAVLCIARDITEIYETREQLEGERLFVGSLLDTSNSLIVCLDRNARITVFNHELELVTGYSREEVLGKRWPDLFLPPEAQHDGLGNFEEWVKQHPSDKYEGPLKTRAGQIRTVLWSNSVLLHSGGSDFTAIAIGHDITDRKRAENALLESEVRFRQALDKSRDILYRLNLNSFTYDYMSTSVAEVTGYTPDEVIEMGVAGMRTLVHPEDMHRLGHHREDLISGTITEKSATTEYRLKCKSGAYRWLSDSHTVVPAEGGRPAFIIGSVRDITEQREAQEALRASEQFNKTVIQHAPLGVSVRTSTGRLLGCNDAWKRIWNISDERLHEDMTRERSALRFDGRDNYLGEWKEKVKEVYEHGGSVHVRELNVGHAFDFGPQWISQYFYAIPDDTGTVDRVVILTEDITERKQAEEALRKSEEQYRTLQENLPLGIFRSTPVGKIVSVNPAILRMYGYESADQLLNVPAIATYARPEQRREMLDLLSTQGHITDFESEIRRQDGSTMWISTNARAAYDDDGKMIHFDGIDTDITARKAAEDALKASEEKYRRLVELMNDGLGVINENDTITFANDRLCEMLGYKSGELEGKIATDLVEEADKETARTEFERRQQGAKGSYELRMVREDGRLVHLILSTTPLYNGDGDFVGSVAVFTDITLRKQSEDLVRIQRDLGVALGSSRTLHEALECLLDASLQIRGIESGGVYLVDSNSGDLDLEVHRGLPDDFLENVRHFGKESPNTRLVLQGVPVYGPYPDLPGLEKGGAYASSLRSVAVVPIRHEDTVLGSLNLASRAEELLSENVRSAIETFAARIGSVIIRIRAQEALRESERRFREMADMLPQTVFEIDRNMNVTFANIQGLRSFGYFPEDIEAGINAVEFFPLREHDRLRDNVASILGGRDIGGVDYVALRKDGTEFPVSTFASRVIRGREVVGLRGILVDITERKQAEKALRESEERSRTQYRSVPVPTYTWEVSGDDFVLTDYNDKALEVTDGKIHDFLGMRFTAMYPDWSEALGEMRRCLRERKSIRREMTYRYITTGHDAVLLVNYAYVPPASVLVHTENITERVRAVQTLKYRVALERLIAEISTRFINMTSDEVDDGILYALRTISEFAEVDHGYILQYTDDGATAPHTYEWRGEGIQSIFDPVGGPSTAGSAIDIMPWFHDRLNDFELIHVKSAPDLPAEAARELKLMRETGLKSLVLVPMVYGGRLTGALGFGSYRSEKSWSDEDITLLRIVAEIFVNTLERRRAELEVRRVNREKITQARQMAGGFAHEIRNALFPARGSVDKMREMLDRTKVDLVGLRKYPSLADQSLTRALDITSLILQYTKLDSERLPEAVNLGTVVENVLKDNMQRIQAQGVDVRRNASPKVSVLSNARQLYMVINNLMINSLDALDETVAPSITISWDFSRDAAELEFSDNGCGIPPASRDRIFDAFYSTKPDRGTGIGLSTVKKIVEMYGGTIGVIGDVDHGTTFRLTFKRAETETAIDERR